MLDLPEYVWGDIERIAREGMAPHLLGYRTTNTRADLRDAIDIIVTIVDREKARQSRDAVVRSAPDGEALT